MVIRRGFEKETAQDVLMFLMEETGELAKAMRKYLGRKTDQEKADRYGNVREELADVLIIIFDLANILEVPLSEALYEKEQANEKRVWS
jgi:NTP pyrophosphatase (non-canonical NTP hydrolase)